MKQGFIPLLLMIPMLAAAQTPPRDLSLARVITSGGPAESCISALAVTRINGEEATVSHIGFEISPGLYRLNGRTTMKMESCPEMEDGDLLGIQDLEAEFEAGMSYHIGFDPSNADKTEWKLVIWMAEEG